MFGRIKNGMDVIASGLIAFLEYPKLLVPLLLTWIVYGKTILYFKFKFDWEPLTTGQTFATVFGIIFLFSTLLCFSGCWLLEMIEQIENDEDPKLFKALSDTLGSNLVRMLPLAFVWATVWFLLVVLEALLRPKKEKRSKGDYSDEEAVRALVGADQEFSWTGLSFQLIQKMIRMLTFLSLPAICWQNQGPFKAMQSGFKTARKHLVEFLSGYALSEAVAVIIFLPVAILLKFTTGKNAIKMPEHVWAFVYVYIALAWSFAIYIEQMFTAELYMWHMKWTKAVQKAKESGLAEPELKDVKRPSLIDGVADMKERTTYAAQAKAAKMSMPAGVQNKAALTGPIKVNCNHCTHVFKFESFKELKMHDYDLMPANGVQLSCPQCKNMTVYKAV